LNWNGSDDTIACVESVLKQAYTEFHIYLLDNNSEPEDKQKIKDAFAGNDKISLICNDSNLGFGQAHNECIDTHIIPKNYPFVALLNNDTIVHENWLQEGVAAITKNNVGAVACKMLNYYKPTLIDSAGLFMLNTGEILPRGHGKPKSLYSSQNEVISFCAGACFIKTEVIRKHGLFDSFFKTGYEDAELGLRYFLAGETILFEPRSVVYHKVSRSIKKIANREKAIKTQQDIHYTVLKLLPFSVLLWNFFPYVLRTIFLLLLHIFTFRLTYVSVWLSSIKRLFSKDMRLVSKSRRQSKRKFSQILNMQTNFIAQDFQRFIVFFIKRQQNHFEKMSEQNL